MREIPYVSEIDIAKSGMEALQKIKTLKPNCIILDINMPIMNGLSVLKVIMKRYPTPTILFSAHTKKDADLTLKGLALGAVGFIEKPSGEVSLNIEKVKMELFSAIQDVYDNKLKFQDIADSDKNKILPSKYIIIIGASTGGPQTLETLLNLLPDSLFATIILVQHMGNLFIDRFISRLNKTGKVVVKLIEKQEMLNEGVVYCMPAGFTMDTRKKEGSLCLSLHAVDHTSKNSPCIDDVMISISAVMQEKTIGVILTGSGDDGLLGMKAIKQQGGITIAQDESALIFGMPKEVINAGVADFILPLEKIPAALLEISNSR